MNRIELIGNLGQEANIRTVGKTRVIVFDVATNHKYKDAKGQPQEEVEWHRVEAWGWIVDAVEGLLVKGVRVYVVGSVKYTKWEKADKTIGYATIIKAQAVHIVKLNKTSTREEAPLNVPPEHRDQVSDPHTPLDEDGDDSQPF